MKLEIGDNLTFILLITIMLLVATVVVAFTQ